LREERRVKHGKLERGARRRARVAGAAAVVGGALVLAGAVARAQAVYDLTPMAAVGATTNATAAGTSPTVISPDQQNGAFTTVSVGAGARYQAARASYAVADRLSLTRFTDNSAANSLTNAFTVGTSVNATARIELRLSAGALLSRASAVEFSNPTTAAPQASFAGTSTFLGVSAGQEATYQPNARQSYAQALSFAQVHYLDSSAQLPSSTVLAATVRAGRLVRRDTFFVEGRLTDSFTSNPAIDAGPLSSGQIFLAQLQGGWRRDLTPALSAEVQAGPIAMFKIGGPGVIAPGGSASLSYRRLIWFANVALTQTASPNLFVGGATISDQIFARLALPLGKSELYYVAGYGGYVYARMVNDTLTLTRAFDQLVGGLSLAARLQKLPVFASVTYLVVDQRGSGGPNDPQGEIPDLARQTVMLNVAGTFAFGRGTPPIFGAY
jgi:hypothetical protein